MCLVDFYSSMKKVLILDRKTGTIAERRCHYGHTGIEESDLSR